MAVIVRRRPTNVDKSGRKRGSPGFDPSTAGGGGGGSSAPPTSSKFRELAKQRGVNLPAEQRRARSQLQTGQRVGGTTSQTLARQAGIRNVETVDISKIPLAEDSGTGFDKIDSGVLPTGFDKIDSGVLPQPKEQFSLTQTLRNMFTIPELTTKDLITGELIKTNPINALQILSFMGISPTNTGTIPASSSLLKSPNWRIGGEAGVKAAGQAAKNTWAAKKTLKLLQAIAKEMGKPKYIAGAIGGIIGIYGWGEWSFGEAKEGMNIGAAKALETGDPILIAEYMKTMDEIYDVTFWQGVQRAIPGPNLAFGFGKKSKALMAQKKVIKVVLKNEITALTTGETDDEKYARIRQEEIDQQQLITDNRIKADKIWKLEKIKLDRLANEFRLNEQGKFNEEERKLAAKQFRDNSRFLAKQAEKERRREAEDRIAIAKFWLEYRKVSQEITDNNRPSALNFGLI